MIFASKKENTYQYFVDLIDQNIHLFGEAVREKLELADYKDAEYRFFVRTGADRNAVESAFGAVSYVKAVDGLNETAFVTEQMSGKAYEAAAEKLGDIINMIRVN